MEAWSDLNQLATMYFSSPVCFTEPEPLDEFHAIFTVPVGVSNRNGRLPSPNIRTSRVWHAGSAVELVIDAIGSTAPDFTNTGMSRVSAAISIEVPPEVGLPVQKSNH